MVTVAPSPARRLWALISVLVLAAASTLLVPMAPASGEATTTVAVNLEGPARFTVGDDMAWADPAFDDSGWDQVTVPYNNHPAFATYDGFGWYRITFDLPANAAGANLVAALGYIDDADEAYLNGVLIGKSGSFSPADSQWFERRLYPVPADAPVYGGRNVLAVRMLDMNGGGGWYQGPIGIYSKDALREQVHGITGTPADAKTTAAVRRTLEAQRQALASGNLSRYLSTLRVDYNHDGHDKDRRAERLQGWLDESGGSLTLVDSEVEVIVTTDGRLLVDTNRSITGTRGGEEYAVQPRQQEFLVFDTNSTKEIGNHSRFFRDHLDSTLEVPGEITAREFVVYLPPSYHLNPDREYPVVYLLHGINGGSREWEPRDFGTRLDELFTTGGLAETIVIMPDGESLWYSNTPEVKWRDMFINEMVPTVDEAYRTIADREFRGLSGVSMGGYGAWQMGWSHPELFSSIATHMASLSYTGVRGYTVPTTLANTLDVDLLRSYSYYADVCAQDWYGFANGHRTMSSRLTARDVPHTIVIIPTGGHDDACWMPRISDSFGSHSDHFRAHGLTEPTNPPCPGQSCTAPGRRR
ncbi:alpha/beta hydrolase [Aestuariimicrobium ganziense]|uniref:alpha/beta hydrolase n=1 Tax=Aestuariimicrobium ganziense TaxID=2773677 RepID=UPI0019448127|nr:alpha/beta hydrolase-fold protein [Aestuariimicrobium ganziense]